MTDNVDVAALARWIREFARLVAANKDRVDPAALLPTVRWKGHLKQV